MILIRLVKFIRCQIGAVAVDWVVLTAAIIGLGVGVILTVSSGTGNVGTVLGGSLSASSVAPVVFQ